jgi:hypothetical protein
LAARQSFADGRCLPACDEGRGQCLFGKCGLRAKHVRCVKRVGGREERGQEGDKHAEA